jgi:DNA polymerase-3 subunit delta
MKTMPRKPATEGRNMVFVGMEGFLLEERLASMKGAFMGDVSMNWSVFNAEEQLGVEEVVGLCNTLPFLADERVGIVRNAQRLKDSQIASIERYLDDPCDATRLILCMDAEEQAREADRVLRRLGGRVEVVRFDPVRDRGQRIRWIVERARMRGKSMGKDAASLLADTAGSALAQLDGEIAKLCLYVGERPEVTTTDVQAVAVRSVEPAFFAFMDSLFERRKDAWRVWPSWSWLASPTSSLPAGSRTR